MKGFITDLFWFTSIKLIDPITDTKWREFRAARRLGRGEITNSEAYKIIYGVEK